MRQQGEGREGKGREGKLNAPRKRTASRRRQTTQHRHAKTTRKKVSYTIGPTCGNVCGSIHGTIRHNPFNTSLENLRNNRRNNQQNHYVPYKRPPPTPSYSYASKNGRKNVFPRPFFWLIFSWVGSWPWIVTFDGFNTILNTFSYPNPPQPKLAHDKHPAVLGSESKPIHPSPLAVCISHATLPKVLYFVCTPCSHPP